VSLSGGELEVVTGGAPAPAEPLGQAKAIEGRSLWQIAWRRLKKDKVAMAGGVVALLLALVAVFAGALSALYGHDWKTQNPNLLDPSTTMPIGAFGGANSDHWLGITPVLGQDVFAGLLYGARTSLIIASLATLLSLVLGVSLGLLAGYSRGWRDSVIARTMDMLLAFPTLLFSIALLSVFSIVPSFAGLSGVPLRFAVIIFVLGFFGFPYIGRIVRGQVLSLREKEFVDASRSLGASNFRIMTREIMPNLVGPILVYTTLTIPNYILGEAGLSFLGVGVTYPTASWGQMLSDAGNYFEIDPTYLIAPGVTIFIAVMAFNLFGDGLRDALDPKSTR
jgi:peptide/nickel transport system permease protein